MQFSFPVPDISLSIPDYAVTQWEEVICRKEQCLGEIMGGFLRSEDTNPDHHMKVYVTPRASSSLIYQVGQKSHIPA